MIKLKSVYDKPMPEDGRRILVDLFWPEGVKTLEAKVDEWLSALGPSYDLQRFYFDTNRWDEYKSMYTKEILHNKDKKKMLQELAGKAKRETVTLLYGNKDQQHNHARILQEMLENHT